MPRKSYWECHFSAIYGNDEIYDHVNLTPLHRIVLGLNSADLEAQLGLSAKDIDMVDSRGRTPIWWAAEQGDIAKLKILLRWGADCNKPDASLWMPLHAALAFGDDDCVEELLAYGAVVDAADIGGAQPIHNIFFSTQYRPRTIELLLRYGADPNAPDEDGTTPLCYAAAKAYQGNCSSSMQNALELIDLGADIEKACRSGYTPVLEALFCNNIELFDFFVSLNARLDRTIYSGQTILHLAAWYGTLEWWERLTQLAWGGRLATVDVYAGHNGHDTLDCMGKCRDEEFVGKRQPRDVEIAAFRELFEAVEGSVLGIAPQGTDEFGEDVLFEDAAGDLDSTGEWLNTSNDNEQEQAEKHEEVVAGTEVATEEVDSG
ncbi:ankyrin repeat-containing domain protein [Lasiosphaeria miniovina]|uniref:Ankyrin repeat-containing domain protein n=1 Tax=Lasiosphaeria miniovina TaxID=1954250 RepID=A0AA40DY73_9PEZI|nr:ankyrin repeat-containing domain protein [Lasiosphaeria miniovina]KAK0717366.1 ankyrin repeat-containing domain protein [Lasiosphaeria miniovina]